MYVYIIQNAPPQIINAYMMIYNGEGNGGISSRDIIESFGVNVVGSS